MPALSLPVAGHATLVAIDDVTSDGVGDVIVIYDGDIPDLILGSTDDELVTILISTS